MDSKPHVSLSTTQAYPLGLALSSSSGSLPIRAPPTLDDFDFEISIKTNGHKLNNSTSSSSSSYSDSDFESEGLVSGEEEFDTASERPFAADPDEETLEESCDVEEYMLSGPSMADPDEESLGTPMEEEEESGEIEEYGPFVEPVVADYPYLNRVMPIAQLSGDGDDDNDVLGYDELVSDVEDGGFPGALRVPGIGVVEKIDGVPRIKVLGVEEGEEDDSLYWRASSSVVNQSETSLEAKGDEASVSHKIVEVGNGVSSTEGEELSVVRESVNNSVSVELVEDKGTGVTEEAHVESLVEESTIMVNGTDRVSSVVEEPVEFKSVETDKEVNFTNKGDLVVDGTKHTILMGSAANSAGDIDGKTEFEIKGVEILERSGDLGMVSDLTSPVTEGNGPSLREVLDQCSDIDKLDSKIEPGTDLGVVSHDPIAANVVEDIDNVIEGNGIQTVDSTKFSEPNPAQETKYLGNGDSPRTMEGDRLEDGLYSKCNTLRNTVPSFNLDPEIQLDKEDEKHSLDEVEEEEEEEEEEEGSLSDEDAEGPIFGNSDTAKLIMNELEQRLAPASLLGAESSQDHSQRIDGSIVTDTDGEGEGKELFDSAALTALLKAAASAGSDGGSVTITSGDGSRVYSLERPVGLGSSLRSLRPAPLPSHPDLFISSDLTAGNESKDSLSEEEKKKMDKIQLLRVKFLRLVQRLGHSPEDSIAAQVLYRLVLAAGRHSSQAFSLESAERMAMQLEAEGKDDLDFSLNILVLGKTGVGKSATINSIFGEEKAMIDAFEPSTTAVKEIVGTIDGVKIRVFDTPGLRSSVMEQAFNRKILLSIKKFTKKCPPDVVLYVDRLDTQTRDLNDLPLLRSITSSLGSSIWQSAVVTLTHAASALPDGPSGSPLSYEVFVSQRSHVVQQSISQAVGDLRLMNPSLMNPMSLVENHPLSIKNSDGQIVLPNGQSWRPQLLLLCYSIKILSEASSTSKPQDPFDHRKLFGFRVRSPPLPYLLSSLLQSHAHPKLSTDQGGDNVDSDIELGDLSDSDQEDEDEYDQLPPFKPLRKSQIAKLTREQRKAYFEEYDYRVKLLQKKQWREEVKRMREIKKKGKDEGNDYDYTGEDQEYGSPATVAVPLPDMVLPPSFDGDNPAYRYRFLEPTSQLLTRPVLDTNGWDHDCGYDGVSLEENLAIAGRFPGGIAVQITKDKKEFNIHLNSSVSAKHGENGSTMAGFDIQTIGKQLAYILRGETKIKNFKMNNTAAGVSITFLGENVAGGLKIEDQIAVGKRLVLVGSTGVVRSQGDAAYGANLEVRLKEKDFPIGQDQSTFGLSLVKWRGDLSLMANIQSQFSIGRSSKMAVRVGLNNKQSGQITVRTSSSEQLQIALMGILPIAITIFRSIYPGSSGRNSTY